MPDEPAKTDPNTPSPGKATPASSDGRGAAITSWLTVGLLSIFGGGLLAAVLFEAPVIQRLSDPAFTRGLITWIISMSTIGIAFVLIYQAFFSVESSDDRFRRGREIFTGLMGVLGTIVGFYFGSADKGATVAIAEIKFADKQLITNISGGSKPYRYSITSSETGFVPVKKISDDGWILETLPQIPKSGSAITVEVTDSKDQKISRKLEIPGDAKATPTPGDAKATPTPPPHRSETPGARPAATPPPTSSSPSPNEAGSPAR